MQSKRLVNPGFLQGPFVAVYGFGGVGIYLLSELFPFERWGVWAWIALVLLPSVVEYIAGWFTETWFGVKLWDYSDLPFHLHGRVCLLFSFFWGLLAVGVILWVQPALLSLIHSLPGEWRWLLTGWLSMYLVVDFWFSANMYQRYARWIRQLKENLSQIPERLIIPSMSLKESQRYFKRLFHPMEVFPHLAKQFRERLKETPDSFLEFVKRFLPRE
nr:putative ABC transporter permease [Thermospira aquatica]